MDYKSDGLSLISSYSDDEEDNVPSSINLNIDVHLGTHKSSENKSPTLCSKTQSIDSTKKLPLPSTLTKLFKTSSHGEIAPIDSPDQHDGRMRSFPHERGNWSTFVYIPYEPENNFDDLIIRLKNCALQSELELKTISPADLHISVTRTVVLLHHWINGFVASVKLNISHIPSFCFEFGSLAVYCNDERSRTFLGLRVHTGNKQLHETTKALDLCLQEFRLPPFYEEASFHMSVLWMLGDVQQALQAALPRLNTQFHAFVSDHPEAFYVYVRQCFCKTGNKLFSFDFAN